MDFSDNGTDDADNLSEVNDSADGSVTVNKNGRYIHCITIIGQIEGHYSLPANTKATKYEHIIPRLVAVEENPDISGLLVILNTVGGDIEAGLAMAELISGMKKPTVSLVLGGSHSIGIPLAVSADKSFIVPTASMTVHPVRMNGLILGVPQTLVYLKKMEERVVDFIVRNSSVSGERFRRLMLNNNELVSDFGTVLNGEQAVKEGLIDSVGGLSDALETLYDFSNSSVEVSEQ
ncbi:MAG: ATP-dependent Clp protease proteolytic subunit [Clostridia bacterium]|nr:ATP-dependent Clp protease proteolytic subunit [Clostridia bacterium]